MKKRKIIFCFLIVFVSLFAFVFNVKAANFDSISGGNEYGKEFKIKVLNAKGWILNYSDYKSYISCGGSETSASSNPYGRLINSNSVEIKCQIIKKDYVNIKFVLYDKSLNNASVEKNYEINPLNKQTTTNQQATTTTTTTTTTSNKSDNTNLRDIKITDTNGNVLLYTPTFNSSLYDYSLTVASEIEKVKVDAIKDDETQQIIYSNNTSETLKAEEDNKITITVISALGSKKIYSITIKREALNTDATLKSITIKEVPAFSIIDNVYSYDVNIDKNIDKLSIDYKKNDDTSSVELSGNNKLKNGSKIKILVTAQDGTKREYVLNIVKSISTTKNNLMINQSDKNPLVIIGLSLIAVVLIGLIIYEFKK